MNRKTIVEKMPSHADCFKSILSATICIRDYKHHDLAADIQNRGVVIDDNLEREEAVK